MKKIIISLTSYPARIDTVHLAIRSILRQTVQADKILLWLSIEEFPNKYADLPQSLLLIKEAPSFMICWVDENLKPHKKYYYALQKFRDDIVITVDDDTYYESAMIETLLRSYKAHPTSISARNVHRIYAFKNIITPYCTWSSKLDESEDIESMDLCAIGVGGILYPPGCSHTDWFKKDHISALAENQDDLWLKFQEVRSGIPVVYVKAQADDNTIEGSQITSLMAANTQQDNDLCIKKLFQFYKEELTIKNWILRLQQIKEAMLYKKQVCIEKLIPYKHNISIFGAGINAEYLFLFISKYIPEICIDSFVVSDRRSNPQFMKGIPVIQLDDLKKPCTLLIGVSRLRYREIEHLMQNSKKHKWITVNVEIIRNVYQGLSYVDDCESRSYLH